MNLVGSASASWNNSCRLNGLSHTSKVTLARLLLSSYGFMSDMAAGVEGCSKICEQEFGRKLDFDVFPGDATAGETPRRWARRILVATLAVPAAAAIAAFVLYAQA